MFTANNGSDVGRIPVAVLANPPALIELFAETIVEELDFRLELRNPSQGPAADVHLVQVVPEGLEFVSATTGGNYDPANHVIRWALGALTSSQMVAFTADQFGFPKITPGLTLNRGLCEPGGRNSNVSIIAQGTTEALDSSASRATPVLPL